jgi:hypothetical protein
MAFRWCSGWIFCGETQTFQCGYRDGLTRAHLGSSNPLVKPGPSFSLNKSRLFNLNYSSTRNLWSNPVKKSCTGGIPSVFSRDFKPRWNRIPPFFPHGETRDFPPFLAQVAALQATDYSLGGALDSAWMCLCGALVMFMHLGARRKHAGDSFMRISWSIDSVNYVR